MSRSVKKTPIFPITMATSEKEDKKCWNKAFRRTTKSCMLRGAEPPLRLREVSDVWDGAKDGKVYQKDFDKEDLRK